MDQLSKIVSLGIGLIIVVIAFATFTGKVNLTGGLPKFLSNITAKTTPTPQITQTKFKQLFDNSSPELKQSAPAIKYNGENTKNSTTSIPATGNPTVVIPFALSIFALGNYLRKIK